MTRHSPEGRRVLGPNNPLVSCSARSALVASSCTRYRIKTRSRKRLRWRMSQALQYQRRASNRPLPRPSGSLSRVRAERPNLFATMFRYRPAAISIAADDELAAASDASDAGLALIQAAIDDGDLAADNPFRISLKLWAAAHGVASISLLSPDLATQILSDVVDTIFRGLR